MLVIPDKRRFSDSECILVLRRALGVGISHQVMSLLRNLHERTDLRVRK